MVIDLATYRRTGKIVQRIPIYYDDAMIAKAREIELALHKIEMGEALLDFSRVMSGDCRPADTEQGTS